ncbi:coiled-coil domain-containing protein [Actinomadura napierensis]|uniref:ARB-07466-like C-terminal domain-containing protein n=1 Tax=Actinomadura napierensis TaxID=267854 RepID=A0ABN2ZKF6_9ACTN
MAALGPYGRTARPAGGRRTARRLAVLVLAVGMSAALPPAAGGAARVPAEPKKDLKKEYAKLEKRADTLSKQYRGELISLEEAKKSAERAGADAERADREYGAARLSVVRIASTTYMTGRLDVIPMVTSGDPVSALRDASVIEHISQDNGRRVESLQALNAKAAQSHRAAQAELDGVRKEIDDLEGQRARVKKLLAKYKPEVPKAPAGGGKPDGVSGTKSPIAGNSMTARMRTALQDIDGKFGPFPTIGCSRPGDPQDHGSGTACDFMESTGGKMPSASAKAHGDRVAQYVIDNASRLGIKYVIWRQRIYDMRGSGGWRQMEDRGSVTQNHYDHVHVSVL